jgi:Homeodomain-like domain
MLALALVLDGHSREGAAEACGMDRQTLRDWVHRYMCGCPLRVKLRVATMAPRARVRSCVRPPFAAWTAAGPDELRGAGA